MTANFSAVFMLAVQQIRQSNLHAYSIGLGAVGQPLHQFQILLILQVPSTAVKGTYKCRYRLVEKFNSEYCINYAA